MEIYCTSYEGNRLTLLRLRKKAGSAHAVKKRCNAFKLRVQFVFKFYEFFTSFYSFESC